MAVFYVPRPSSEENWGGRLQNLPPSRVLLNLLAGNPFPQKFWKYDYDDAAFWLRSSRPITTLRMPAGGGFPFKPPYWKFNYDDSAFWVGTPNRSIPEIDEPAGGGFPFKPPYWKYDHDSPGFWVGAKSTAVFPPNIPITFHILSTQEIQLPVNCVLIGDQVYETGKHPLSGNLFKSIFRE